MAAGQPEKPRLICAPLMAQSVEQMLKEMHQAKMEGADLVEIRLGSISNFEPLRDLKILLGNCPLPVAVVCRSSWEGVRHKGDEKEELQALTLAKDLGADYIELELEIASALIKEDKFSQFKSSKIIVSSYLDSFTASKEVLSHLVAKLQSTEADIIKLVSNAADITEIVDVFELLSNSQAPTIAYCTGERGLISQLLSFKFGGVFVYGHIQGYAAIPGLPSIHSLTQVYRVKSIDENTKVIGLISKPISHSKGPILHNPTFRHVGYNGIYVPMFVDDLKAFFDVYNSPDFPGFSVGIPYKEAIIDFCDEVHPLAQSIGAVNTIIRRPTDGKLIGYNTDCEAAISAIEDALTLKESGDLPSPIKGCLFVVVGAGGAGRALAFGAKARGARILVFDIDIGSGKKILKTNFQKDRANSLAGAVSGEALPFEELPKFKPEKGAILANATPLGMHPNVDRIPPVAEETLRDYKLVFDAVYNPSTTRLLKAAQASGAIVVSGVEMFLGQAAAQFSLFTSLPAPEELMRLIILDKFL